ncbi:class I SAM-dependent RNA methyltransferase [Stappia indica]|uniref:class I SAM-dependent RNA methyltransferase n=1 Tax=Stappia indica TaxID=538381 RepID=UPI001CD25DBA|nr:RNA methyltransferase [Stappia indica]MCA1297871.1 RNA methyltransferase [Stappia indica]
MSTDLTTTITALAHKGEGRTDTPDGPVHVPYTLPGEEVRISVEGSRARLSEVLTPAPERVEPVCRHFGSCGGCALQHMAHQPYLDWKRELVVSALAARGLTPEVEPTVDAAGRGRRRAVLAATGAGGRVLLGYHQRASHRLVAIRECPVLVPEIVAALADLSAVAKPVLPRKGEVTLSVLATSTGLDVALTSPVRVTRQMVPELVETAMAAGFARLSLNGDVLVEARAPLLDIGGAPLVPPPGGFVQATAEGEAALAERVVVGVGKARKVADLFAGSGTFALRLARKATVHAVEGEAAALAALDRAARGASGLRPVRIERRDLFRNPLTALEIDDFGEGVEAVVFDPPRAGAEAQARELARSKVPTVVAVSCNPGTLARDLRHLVDGGYRIASVLPVDQFRYSPHIEVVVVLHRDG